MTSASLKRPERIAQMREKTYIYARDNGHEFTISESGTCPDNCDCVTAIGRPPKQDEIVGCGITEEDAFLDALTKGILCE